MPVTFKGSAGAFASSVALPAHVAGDLIVIYSVGELVPSIPAAGGTVPSFTNVTTANNQRIAYAVATSSNHTSGTWTDSFIVMVAVLSGEAAPPIGGVALSTSTTPSTAAVSPSIALSDTSGNSGIVHFAAFVQSARKWTSTIPPAGYTQRANSGTLFDNFGYRVLTKDVSTSDGAVANSISGGTAVVFGGSVEILSAPVAGTASASLAVTANTSATAVMSHSASSSLSVTATASAGSSSSVSANASLAATATTSSGFSQSHSSSSALSVSASTSATAGRAQQASSSITAVSTASASVTRNAPVQASLSAVATPTGQVRRTQPASSSLAVTAARSAQLSQIARAQASLSVTASTSAALSRRQQISASFAAQANASSVVSRDLTFSASLSVELSSTVVLTKERIAAVVKPDDRVALAPASVRSASTVADVRNVDCPAPQARTVFAVDSSRSAVPI